MDCKEEEVDFADPEEDRSRSPSRARLVAASSTSSGTTGVPASGGEREDDWSRSPRGKRGRLVAAASTSSGTTGVPASGGEREDYRSRPPRGKQVSLVAATSTSSNTTVVPASGGERNVAAPRASQWRTASGGQAVAPELDDGALEPQNLEQLLSRPLPLHLVGESFEPCLGLGAEYKPAVYGCVKWGQPMSLGDRFVYYFFEQWKGYRKEVRLAFDEVDDLSHLPKLFHREGNVVRWSTSNWKRHAGGGLLTTNPHSMVYDDVDGLLGYHQGEARAWQTEPECWRRLSVPASREELGGSHQQLKAASGADDEVIFPREYVSAGCDPDLTNAISTVAVYDVKFRDSICWRDVKGFTLSEVFCFYADDFSYKTLYDIWRQGALIIRCREKRGTKAGGSSRSRDLGSSSSSQWRSSWNSSHWRSSWEDASMCNDWTSESAGQ
jgi:hypothetical protein